MNNLEKLCNIPSPAGFEKLIVKELEKEFNTIPHKVDNLGNLLFTQDVGEQIKKILISAHIDELGLIISGVTEDGFIHFLRNSGEDRKCLQGHRFTILTQDGKEIPAVCMKKAIHLETDEEYNSVDKVNNMVLSVGANNREEVYGKFGINIGDLVVYERNFTKLGEYKVASQGLDDKAGSWVVMEVLKNLKLYKNSEVSCGFCCQEETGLVGASTLMTHYKPDISIDLDVCHSTENSLGIDKNIEGDIELGKGVVIEISSSCSRELSFELIQLAKDKNIPFQIKAGTGGGTNTRRFQERGEAKTCLLSIPCQNMHTPVEIIDMRDLESAKSLILAWLDK